MYRLRYLPSFSASLLRLWSQLKGGCVRDQWVLLCEYSTPLPIDQLTSRFSYVSLSRFADTPHRCTSFSALGFDVPWPHVWQLPDLWRFTRAVQDTAWLSFHGILPTTDRLLRFRMNMSPAYFCGADESLLQRFSSCPFANEVFAWFLLHFHRFRPGGVLTPQQILFGFDPSDHIPIGYDALLGILRHQIWLARNCPVFDHHSTPAIVSLQKATSTFRFLLHMQQRSCPLDRFSTLWLANGCIGRVSEHGHLHLHPTFSTSLTS